MEVQGFSTRFMVNMEENWNTILGEFGGLGTSCIKVDDAGWENLVPDFDAKLERKQRK